MAITITPAKLTGSVRAVPSKAQTQRVFICAALSDRPMEVVAYGVSGETETILDCLRAMGTKIRQVKDGRWRVEPLFKKGGGKVASGKPVLCCSDSKAAFCFLLPVGAALFNNMDVKGDASSFPILIPILNTMGNHGCQMGGDDEVLSIQKRMHGGDYLLPDDMDARFLSGLLLAAPLMREDSNIILKTYLEQEQFVDLTIDVMERFGVVAYENETGYQIPGKQTYVSPKEFRVEGDWGLAAVWLCARQMGQEIKIDGLFNRSAQVERQIGRLMDDLGEGAVVDGSSVLNLVPFLAVAAAAAEGQTRITNLGGLLGDRNRLEDIVCLMESLGADVKGVKDELIINGKGWLTGGNVPAFDDPYLILAAVSASCICKNEVVLADLKAVEAVYPRFLKDFRNMGGVYRKEGEKASENGEIPAEQRSNSVQELTENEESVESKKNRCEELCDNCCVDAEQEADEDVDKEEAVAVTD